MILIDNDGTISLYQGDSGELVISGLDDDKTYTIYFSIQDEDRNTIGEELMVSVSNSNTAIIVLTPEYTDLLTVPAKKPYAVYYYGIKVCVDSQNIEDTVFVSDGIYGDLNLVIVYPRKVRGI